MSTPFVGQLQTFAFNFAPKGWALCNGQILGINQNQALFALIGTYYGGNGTSNFQLPNLMGRVPLGVGPLSGGPTYTIGETAGTESVTITTQTMASHNHIFSGLGSDGTAQTPITGGVLTNVGVQGGAQDNFYAPDTTTQSLNSGSVGLAGGNQGHTNVQPYLVINWCIALSGLFPSRN